MHGLASNAVLAEAFHSLPRLFADPVMQRWVDFAKKQRTVATADLKARGRNYKR